MANYVPALDRLVEEFRKMPSIGTKSAERLAFYVLSLKDKEIQSLPTQLRTLTTKFINAKFVKISQKMRYARFVQVKRETEALSAWFPTRETLSHLKRRTNTEDFITFYTELFPL